MSPTNKKGKHVSELETGESFGMFKVSFSIARPKKLLVETFPSLWLPESPICTKVKGYFESHTCFKGRHCHERKFCGLKNRKIWEMAFPALAVITFVNGVSSVFFARKSFREWV